MLRRTVLALGLAVASLLLMAGAATADVRPGDAGAAASTTTSEARPGTTLEAEIRDDDTSPAPWLIGSAVAAAAVVAIGGSILKRRAD